ncbi:hypothetical protein JW935_13000 [candidate division KSB1 bacterium]|nr:hypothetical protein [candidate division KSB1 bacterium]
MKKIFTFIVLFISTAFCREFNHKGQVSGWGLYADKQVSIGCRYIPSVFFASEIGGQWSLDSEIAAKSFYVQQGLSLSSLRPDHDISPYRFWIRLTSNQFEARVGLQKINFGAAKLLRPLMWFDRIDPRDPLQLTDGVYGLLCRYYFLNNVNVWMWGLMYNNEPKGMEILGTEKNTLEYGGRLQFPVSGVELGMTLHRRKADPNNMIDIPLLSLGTFFENRFAFDARMDVGVGLWVEGAVSHYDHDLILIPYRYVQQAVLGGDYTVELGNGLTVLAEHFVQNVTDKILDKKLTYSFSAMSLNYPLTILDYFAGMVFYDWTEKNIYRFLYWQRTYDFWNFYLFGFWNSEQGLLNDTLSSAMLGKGVQVMLVFNY